MNGMDQGRGQERAAAVESQKCLLGMLTRWLNDEPPMNAWPPESAAVDVLAAACANRLDPLLYSQLPGGTPPPAWAAVRARLHAAYRFQVLRGWRGLAAAAPLLDGLAAAGVDCLALRGPFAGAVIYDDLGLRPFVDIDVLVPRGEARRAWRLASTCGLQPESGTMPWRFLARHHLHGRLRAPDSAFVCELHWALDHPYARWTVDYPALFARAEEGRAERFRWRQPCPEHLVVLACLHLMKHCRVMEGWVEAEPFPSRALAHGWLGYWVEVAQVARRYARCLDWDEVLRVAESWRASDAVAVGLSGARRLADRWIPETVSQWLRCRRTASPPVALTEREGGWRRMPGVASLAALGGFQPSRLADLSAYLARSSVPLWRRGWAGLQALYGAGELVTLGAWTAARRRWLKRGLLMLMVGLNGIGPLHARGFVSDAPTDTVITLQPGDTVQGIIAYDTESDWYGLAVPAAPRARRYRVTVTCGTLWDSVVTLLGAEDTERATDSLDAQSANLSWLHTGAETTVYVRVCGFAQFTTGTYSVAVSAAPYAPDPDLDADGQADPSAYQASSGVWGGLLSSDGYRRVVAALGGVGCEEVTADYDGDGYADPAVYREADGVWGVLLSSAGYSGVSAAFGGAGWLAAIGDYDGDGAADPAVYGPSAGVWAVRLSSAGYRLASLALGGAGYTPAPGDYDDDGFTDPAVYQESSGAWLVCRSSAGYTVAPLSLGGAGCQAMPADYDGDGRADPAVYLRSQGLWAALLSDAAYAPVTFRFGGSAYQPIPADYDGDGRADPAVFDEAAATWYVFLSTTGTVVGYAFYP